RRDVRAAVLRGIDDVERSRARNRIRVFPLHRTSWPVAEIHVVLKLDERVAKWLFHYSSSCGSCHACDAGICFGGVAFNVAISSAPSIRTGPHSAALLLPSLGSHTRGLLIGNSAPTSYVAVSLSHSAAPIRSLNSSMSPFSSMYLVAFSSISAASAGCAA